MVNLPDVLCILKRRQGRHVTPIRVIVYVGLREVFFVHVEQQREKKIEIQLPMIQYQQFDQSPEDGRKTPSRPSFVNRFV